VLPFPVGGLRIFVLSRPEFLFFPHAKEIKPKRDVRREKFDKNPGIALTDRAAGLIYLFR
jgi:hypothetical protein